MKGVFMTAAVAAATLASATGWADLPNILWIYTDDQSDDAGFFGTPAVSTPRMDALAAEGVVYRNAYTTSPACSPSRTAMMTGVYQTSVSLAMHHRPASRQPLPGNIEPISEYFRDAGYFVGNAKDSFDGNGKFDMNFAGDNGSALAFSDLFDGNDWRQAASDQPWFVQVNLFEPHRPFRGQNTDLARRAALDLPDDLPEHPIARADYADYLASIERADAKIGAVLDRLEADGLADNTIVFWVGDNGREFTRAKGAAYDAGSHVPLVARIPEAYRTGRGDLAPGSVYDGVVSTLDVTAASLAAAGVDLSALPHLHGQDLLAANYDREEVVWALDRHSEVPSHARSVRVGDLLYIRNHATEFGHFFEGGSWYSRQERPIHALMEVMLGRGLKTAEDGLVWADSRPPEELYDLSVDPYQLNNLANEPTQTAVLDDFRTRLTNWARTTGDKGGEFDPDLAPAQAWHENVGRFRHLDDKGLPRDTTAYEYLEWWAELFNEPIDLAEGEFDREQFWIGNRSFENTPLGEGGFAGGAPQGWTDATGGVWIQNQTAAQMSPQAADGANVLLLDSGDSTVRWAIDDDWGNTLAADEASAWRFELSAAVGRRLGVQGDEAGLLRVSLQTEAGDEIADALFSLEALTQGEFTAETFSLLVDRNDAATHAGETLYLALTNEADSPGDGRRRRVVLDDLQLAITPLSAGDYNYDGVVDQADQAVWEASFGSTDDLDADGNGDGRVDAADYTVWRDAQSAAVEAIPEPGSAGLALGVWVLHAASARRASR